MVTRRWFPTLLSLTCLALPGSALAAGAQREAPDAEAAAAEPDGAEAGAPTGDAADVGEMKPWVVAVNSEEAPFSMRAPDGSWTGISVELWQQIATKHEVPFEFRELKGQELVEAVGNGEVDVILAAIVSAGVEEALDLSHAYYSTGLAIAVKPGESGGILATAKRFVSLEFLRVIGALFLVILIIGALMWLAERRHNEAEFGGSAGRGIWQGLWWSAVTMTTVGYGDKSPRTTAGRVLGLIWMFAAILIISSFTARIASSLTVNELGHAVNGPDDLPKVKVGVVETEEYDAPGAYLGRRGVPYHRYANATELLTALDKGEIDAAVYEAPTLQYYVSKNFSGSLKVLAGTFENHGYAFALQAQGRRELLEALNLALLNEVEQDSWKARVRSYLNQ